VFAVERVKGMKAPTAHALTLQLRGGFEQPGDAIGIEIENR
jgi:hypothetical protein